MEKWTTLFYVVAFCFLDLIIAKNGEKFKHFARLLKNSKQFSIGDNRVEKTWIKISSFGKKWIETCYIL